MVRAALLLAMLALVPSEAIMIRNHYASPNYKFLPQGIVSLINETLANERREKLLAASEPGAEPVKKFDYARCHRSDSGQRAKDCFNSGKESVFEAVEPSLKLPKDFFVNPNLDSSAQEKLVLKMNAEETKGCVVYGVGINQDSRFEESMAKQGCEVHAFDCTISSEEKSIKDKHFNFHKTCMGAEDSFKAVTGGASKARRPKGFEIKTMSHIKEELGHKQVDILKVDIEGFEWNFFENEFLNLPKEDLPVELSFELHTEEANQAYFPEGQTNGKGYNEVSRLFLKLHDLGYRVLNKHVTGGDAACAEFVLLNVLKLQA